MDPETIEILQRLKKEQAEKNNDNDYVESQKDTAPKETDPSYLKKKNKANQKLRNGKADDRSNVRRAKAKDKLKMNFSEVPQKLPAGFTINTKYESYKVEAAITPRVYIARSNTTNRFYAMKIEWIKVKSIRQLKKDVYILQNAAKKSKRFNRHFLRIHNKGRWEGMLNYLLMTMCDYNMDDLRLIVLEDCDFSQKSAARLCLHSFQAIHDLHSLGYIHRNITPSKFVLGLHNPHLIMLVGFSLSHHFNQPNDSKDSPSSQRLPKLSNIVFASRSYHRNKELNRKDDLEMWIYVCINLFGRRILPWNHHFSPLNMFVNKERLFCDEFEEMYKYVPPQFKTIMHSLEKMDDTQRPDYTLIGMMLVTMKENIKFSLTGPFDWQKGYKEEKVDAENADLLALDEGCDEKKFLENQRLLGVVSDLFKITLVELFYMENDEDNLFLDDAEQHLKGHKMQAGGSVEKEEESNANADSKLKDSKRSKNEKRLKCDKKDKDDRKYDRKEKSTKKEGEKRTQKQRNCQNEGDSDEKSKNRDLF